MSGLHNAGKVLWPSARLRKTTSEMAGNVLYSTNPWIAHDIAVRYRNGVHFAWVSDYFDCAMAPPGSAAAAIAPSSSPKHIYDRLLADCKGEDGHSSLIAGYKRTFKRLAASWESDGTITSDQAKEIRALIGSPSWQQWRPTIYVIPRGGINPGRIFSVARKQRAAYGPESQIVDLIPDEFDIIEPNRH